MPDTPVRTDLIDAVCRALAAQGDPVRATGQQRYMRSALPFHGVTMPQVRTLTRALLTDDTLAPDSPEEWRATVRALWDTATHREERYAAQEVLAHRRYAAWLAPDVLPLIEHLVTTGAWWDHVDGLATRHTGSVLRTHRAEVTPVLRRWMVADDRDGAMWLRRTAILAQLHHREETDLDLLSDAVDANLEVAVGGGLTPYGREFFVRKAIGWALRQHARTDPAWVRTFVATRGGRMSGLSRREALKHL